MNVHFETLALKFAPYFERLCRGELWLQASDGKYYRPVEGWPIWTA